MSQEELKEFYRKADVEELSGLYFRNEGPAKRRKHFEDVWFAVGFQARDGAFTLEKVLRLLGLPDVALGNPSSGKVGWLMQSATKERIRPVSTRCMKVHCKWRRSK